MDVECCRHVLNQHLRQITQSHRGDFEVVAIARDLLNSWPAHRHLQALAQSVNFFGGSPASALSEWLGVAFALTRGKARMQCMTAAYTFIEAGIESGLSNSRFLFQEG